MPTHIRHGRSDCPIARSLDVLGDKWTLLVIREALGGTTRFMDFSRVDNTRVLKYPNYS